MSVYAITGGAGFIGAALAAHLARAGHEVRALDDLSHPESRRRADALAALPRVTLTVGNVRDPDACRALCAGADAVLHHALPSGPDGDDPAACAAVIIGGTLALLAAARGAGTVRRFVCASSGAVYGDTGAPTKHEASPTDPITPQACALLSAELFCRSAFRRHGLQTVCLRYFSVYGPGQDAGDPDGPPLTALLRAAAFGGAATVRGGPETSADYVCIDDVVEANLRAVSAPRGVGGKAFNVAGGRPHSVGQLVERLERLTPGPISVEYAPARPGDIKCQRADICAAAGLLQFVPAVALDDGLAKTLHWMRRSGTAGPCDAKEPHTS